MAVSLFDNRVLESTTTVGTGSFSLLGAVTGYQAFSVFGNGGCPYRVVVYAVDSNGNPSGQWEEFENPTYTLSGTTLSRGTFIASSTGSVVDFAAGLKRVMALGVDAATMRRLLSLTPTNYIINGGFDFYQRQTPGTLTTFANDLYGPDRWRMTINGATFQSQRIDTNGALETGITSRYYGAFKAVTAAKCLICQPIEAANTFPLASRRITFQVSLKASSAMTFRLGVLQLNSSGTIDTIPSRVVAGTGSTWTTAGATGTDPTFGTNLALITPVRVPTGAQGTINGSAVDCSVTTSWQKFAITVDMPSNAKNLIPAIWSNAAQTANDFIYMAEAGLYDMDGIQPWLPLSVPLELTRCQRYYQKQYETDVAPGTASANGRLDLSQTASTAFITFTPHFFISMRATPTVTAYDYAGTSGVISYSTGNGKAVTVDLVCSAGFRMYSDNTTSKDRAHGFYTAEAEL